MTFLGRLCCRRQRRGGRSGWRDQLAEVVATSHHLAVDARTDWSGPEADVRAEVEGVLATLTGMLGRGHTAASLTAVAAVARADLAHVQRELDRPAAPSSHGYEVAAFVRRTQRTLDGLATTLDPPSSCR